jgi:hypothetical protein
MGPLMGLVAGILIIIGGLFVSSENERARLAGNILGIIMALLGAVYTLGGLFIGIILALAGNIVGISTSRSNPPLRDPNAELLS